MKLYVLLAAAVVVAFATPAQAQSRGFACEKRHGVVTITVTGKNSIVVGPVQATTVKLRKSRNDPLYYINGDYGVRFSRSQTELDLEIPDYGKVHCRHAPPGSALARQAKAQNPCGPAGKPVPETDRCIDINANPVEGKLPMWGESLGGIMREGPGMNFRKVGSLREGDRVEIVHSTEERMGDYTWFQVRHQGRNGYQWGGIMCSEDLLPGILTRCNR